MKYIFKNTTILCAHAYSVAAMMACALCTLLYFGGCASPDEPPSSVARDRPAAEERELILEEIDEEATGDAARALPFTRDPRAYIYAADMRIGELYTSDARTGISAALRGCVDDYQNYLLGVRDSESEPPDEAAHPSLPERISEIRALADLPTTTRIGKESINNENSVAFLPILIMTEIGYANGELECRRGEEAWYFYNFVVDLSRLREARAENRQRFNPLLF